MTKGRKRRPIWSASIGNFLDACFHPPDSAQPFTALLSTKDLPHNMASESVVNPIPKMLNKTALIITPKNVSTLVHAASQQNYLIYQR
jgi:hypothetical protein